MSHISYYKKNNWVNVYIGKFRLPPPKPKQFLLSKTRKQHHLLQKAVVFDLDGTLGSFGDLFHLWKGIQNIYSEFSDFYGLLDLYPEFLRNGILEILEFLVKKKKSGKCTKIYLYTNNQCASDWAPLIAKYFCYKINSPHFFDRIIRAFKIGNTIVEVSRTTNKKTYNDLIQCTMLPKSAEYCFIDDSEHSQMKHDKVYYISPKPYNHNLTTNEIIERWVSSSLAKTCILLNSSSFWYQWFSMKGGKLTNENNIINKDYDDYIKSVVYHKIVYHIKEFLLFTTMNSSSSRKTKKINVI